MTGTATAIIAYAATTIARTVAAVACTATAIATAPAAVAAIYPATTVLFYSIILCNSYFYLPI